MSIPSLTPPSQPPTGNIPSDPTQTLTPKEQELFAEVKTVFPGITRDQFLADFNSIQNLVQQFGKDFSSALQSLTGEEPVLPQGQPNALSNLSRTPQGAAAGAARGNEASGNKNAWFNANASVAFAISFQSFMKELSKMKMMQTFIEAKAIEQEASLAKDVGQQIMNAANEEAKTHIASAVAAGVSGALSFASGVYSLGALSKVKGQEKAMEKSGELGTKAGRSRLQQAYTAMETQTRAVSSIAQGLGSVAEAGKSAFTADSVIKKGAAEASAEILRTALHLAQKRGDQASSDKQKVDELFDSFNQTLRQLLEQNIKAGSLLRS
jgi:hypothetical protein